ncbi:MAG TPA: 30S ribosomal protein S11 [Candidatus Moranbacteria bacterium]|nr:30S ribosomal protein S11 [Candidatus Moranbacteria bacterium]HAT74537.1 30S ribosomal protein S11 [Candidatus Moranbacteria bacterium]
MSKAVEQKNNPDKTVNDAEVLEVEKKIADKIVNEAIKPEEKKKFKKSKRQISKGRATIRCSYNNTIVNIADSSGAILGWCSSGLLGFKGAKKATPYAATQVVANIAEKVKKYGVKELEVFVRGVGSGREASIRALANNGFEVIMIKDTTPIPHNGCRAKKPRRV